MPSRRLHSTLRAGSEKALHVRASLARVLLYSFDLYLSV